MNRQFMSAARFLIVVIAFSSLAAFAEEGMGVYYSNYFQGKPMAGGGIFDQESLTAAHKTLPFGTKVKITNPETKQSVIVTITDRMAPRNRNLIDMTRRAAREIGIEKKGRARVEIEVQP